MDRQIILEKNRPEHEGYLEEAPDDVLIIAQVDEVKTVNENYFEGICDVGYEDSIVLF